jgi:hypothetical protein
MTPTTESVPDKSPTRKVKPAVAKTKPQAASKAKPGKASAKQRSAKGAPAAPAAKEAKLKLVRDSFTIPAPEYEALGQLKRRAAKLGHSAKKSEVLRAGIKLLAELPDQKLLAQLAGVPSIKTGRPKKQPG